MSKYYKAFNKDLTCLDSQYEIGKEYEFDDEPIQGFYFCKSIVDGYRYYAPLDDTRICEVEPLGDIAVDECEH